MQSDTNTAVVNSALWAAAGDALGWITELARDGAVEARAGVDYVVEPVNWRRFIGGKMGVRVDLPAGTYSDDTQLRLSVARSIRGDGTFDAEIFALVELTAWQAYALGAGNGTKAAAANLARRGVNWFSNFFDKGARYVTAGGNGAAMRIQPHVWAASQTARDKMFTDVLRDSLVTHGHPHGFVGACFHAAMLFDVLSTGELTPLSRWHDVVASLQAIPSWINRDRQLSAFWIPAWEQSAGSSLDVAVEEALLELHEDIDAVWFELETRDTNAYQAVLERIGALTDRYRGSGLKTALAASILAHLHQGDVRGALVASANLRQSDTDTIATMAGALLGAITKEAPPWRIQDQEYIRSEALRMTEIRRGARAGSFPYPDLAHWKAPTTQSDAVGSFESGLALVGLGTLKPISNEYSTSDAVWQWFALPFGQTILAKRRAKLKLRVTADQLPGSALGSADQSNVLVHHDQLTLDGLEGSGGKTTIRRAGSSSAPRSPSTEAAHLDEWTDAVIRSGFDDETLGRMFNLYLERSGTIEGAIAFASIVAKAKIARNRKSKR